MKPVPALFILLALAAPSVTFAACVKEGATVVYINGIFTDSSSAESDLRKLADEFYKKTNDTSVKFKNGYNPSHFGGAGDLVQSVAQMMGGSVSNYDRDTILLQIYPQVTTRRLLLVGHSQGSFYANAMYEYLLTHGEPKVSVGVYHVGSPALGVADGGGYLNSTNDSLLNAADKWAGKSPLVRNIDLPLSEADKLSQWPGHGFSRVYLAQGAERVIADIRQELGALQAVSASDTGECFTPPAQGVAYQLTKAGFAVGDTAAEGAKVAWGAAHAVGTKVGDSFYAALGAVFGLGGKIAADIGITAGGLAEISQAATDEVRPTNFDILSKLYGSSLKKEDIAELLGSAVAVAPVFNKEPDGEVLGATTVAPPKITYLSGGGSGNDETETSVEDVGGEGDATSDEEPIDATLPVIAAHASIVATTSKTSLKISYDIPIASDDTDGVIDVSCAPDSGSIFGVGTTTVECVAADAAGNSTSTSFDVVVERVLQTAPLGAPVEDTFNNFNEKDWETPQTPLGTLIPFDTETDLGNCIDGGCVVGNGGLGGFGTASRRPYMYLTGEAAEEGAFTVWARTSVGWRRPLLNVYGCVADTECATQVSFFESEPWDEEWHRFYVGWRQGFDALEVCVMRDELDPSHCGWTDSRQAFGTKLDGVVLSGFAYRSDLGDHFWYDELRAVTSEEVSDSSSFAPILLMTQEDQTPLDAPSIGQESLTEDADPETTTNVPAIIEPLLETAELPEPIPEPEPGPGDVIPLEDVATAE